MTSLGLLSVSVFFGTTACMKDVPMELGGGYSLSVLEHQILQEMNRVRANPAAYATRVEARKIQYDKQMANLAPGASGEESKVFDEVMRALQGTTPAPALLASRGLSLAAKEHVGQAGKTPVALDERLKRYGTWEGQSAENVAYGSDTAERFVMQFLLDPDDARRTQRANLLQAGFAMAGAACGPHPQYATVCVVTFAQKYHEKAP